MAGVLSEMVREEPQMESLRWGMLALVSVVMFAFPSVAEEANGAGKVRTELAEIMKLRGKNYVDVRDRIMRREKLAADLATILAETTDWKLALLCEAICFRLSEPEKARLFDGLGPVYGWGGDHSATRNTIGLSTDGGRYLGVITCCFGRPVFPLVAENVLWICEAKHERWAAMYSLFHLRDDRVADVVVAVLRDRRTDLLDRLVAVRVLWEALLGLDPRQDRIAFGQGLFGPRLPPELEKLSKPVNELAFRVRGLVREAIINEIVKVLKEDTEERVRAGAANALERAGDVAVAALGEGLASDDSPWVRAWCAHSLRKIGGDAAQEALAAATVNEKHAEVLTVIRGERKPLDPMYDVPEHARTILGR